MIPDLTFEDFQRKNKTNSEGTVMPTVVPIITGDFDIPNEGHLSFYNLASITDNTTVNLVLNFFDGAYPGTVDKQVRDDLYETIIPNKDAEIPVAPNFSH